MRKLDTLIFEVDFPDGTVRKFSRPSQSAPFSLIQIRDAFGNKVTVSQGTSQWTLTDDHRTQTVNFANYSGEWLVSSVVVSAFGGTTATYQFGYTTTPLAENCRDDDLNTLPASWPMLTSITLPAGGGSYLMNGAGDYYTSCWDGTKSIDDLPGVLHRIKLPTGGSYAWTYQDYSYPVRGIASQGDPNIEVTYSLGVETKTALDGSGSCPPVPNVGCQWTYRWGKTSGAPWERWTDVTYPTGDESRFYFSQDIAIDGATWSGWEYGLPIKKTTTSGTGFYLSQEIYAGPIAGGTKKRSVYMGYEHDKLTSLGGGIKPQQWYNSNRRVARQKTVYHDDGNRYADVVSSEFDGLGHHRRSVTGGSFDSGNVRTDFTLYNPGQGTYTIDLATNVQSGGYVPWPATDPWVLGNSTETWATEGSSSVETQTCFEKANGFLAWQRTHQNGTGPLSTDVLVAYTRDTKGNRVTEDYYGADAGGVPATTPTATCGLSGLPANAYKIQHSYLYGAL
jgi:hypothetical protein